MIRTDNIEPPVFCNIRVFRNDKWYDMKPLCVQISRARKIIARMRRMGKIVHVKWIEGMGLGIS